MNVVTASQWDAMTTAQFASYRAIIIADNHDSGTPADLSSAVTNGSTWGAAVNGNIILAGADPEFHASNGVAGAVTYIKSAIAFAAANPGRTGFYYAGAYYSGTNVHVSVLDALAPNGFFNTDHNSNPIHIYPATKPQVPGLTDTIMSGWNETAHRYFTTWPSAFHVWAIGVDAAGTYTTSDGQKGYPHFLVSERVPPTSTISGAGCTTSGNVSFRLTDNAGGSGPKAIHYTLDGGAAKVLPTTGNPGAATLNVPAGSHTLKYWGEDQDGNMEAAHTTTLLVDDAAGPSLKITSNQHERAYVVGEKGSVKITAKDDLGLSRNPSKSHKHLKTGKAGHFKINVTAIDVCGHKTKKTFRYRVAAPGGKVHSVNVGSVLLRQEPFPPARLTF